MEVQWRLGGEPSTLCRLHVTSGAERKPLCDGGQARRSLFIFRCSIGIPPLRMYFEKCNIYGWFFREAVRLAKDFAILVVYAA